jgi:hypothetical protein
MMGSATVAADFLGVGERQVRDVLRWTLEHQPTALNRQGAPLLGGGETLLRGRYPQTAEFQDWFQRQAAQRMLWMVQARGDE